MKYNLSGLSMGFCVLYKLVKKRAIILHFARLLTCFAFCSQLGSFYIHIDGVQVSINHFDNCPPIHHFLKKKIQDFVFSEYQEITVRLFLKYFKEASLICPGLIYGYLYFLDHKGRDDLLIS